MNSFLNDREIATQLSLSRSWVRKQRWLRRHGLDHVFKIDPVMIGRVPRYKKDDIQSWIEELDNRRGASDAVR